MSKDLAEGVNPLHAKQIHSKSFIVVSRETQNLALIARGKSSPKRVLIFESGALFDIRKCFQDLSQRRHYPHLLIGAPDSLFQKYKNVEPELWSTLDDQHTDRLTPSKNKNKIQNKTNFAPKIGRQAIVGTGGGGENISIPPPPCETCANSTKNC